MSEALTRSVRVGGREHRLDALWLWPVAPAVSVRLDGRAVASVEFFQASASAHWILNWIGDDLGYEGPARLPLMSLAGRVPEEVDADAALVGAVLDVALDAAEDRLSGQPARVARPDG